jgi:lipoate---protein ligase
MASTYALEALDVIDGGKDSAETHMGLDASLVTSLSSLKRPLLHLFEWQRPAITYGYFISPEEHLQINQSDFDYARRPTGGGILFHFGDFSFSLAVPSSSFFFSNIEESYQRLNAPLLEVLKEYFVPPEPFDCVYKKDKNFCMANPTRFDLIWNGYKVGGCAERRTSCGLVHQVSCFSRKIPWETILPLLKCKDEKIEAMKGQSFSLVAKEKSFTRLEFTQAVLSAFDSFFSRRER